MDEIIPFPSRSPQQGEVQTVSLGVFLGALMDGRFDPEQLARDMRHEQTMDALRRLSVPTLRRLWDEVGETSFYYGPEGSFDCADIHRVMNEKGDGRYCAV